MLSKWALLDLNDMESETYLWSLLCLVEPPAPCLALKKFSETEAAQKNSFHRPLSLMSS